MFSRVTKAGRGFPTAALCFVLALGAGLTAAACRPPQPGNDGRLLRVGTSHRIHSANPFSDYYLGIFALVSNPPLMRMDARGRIQGGLAEAVEFSRDRTEWRFRIDRNAFWSDGVRVTPEDVKFSIELIGRHSPSEGWIRQALLECRAQPDGWVMFRFRDARPRLDLEFCAYRILPRHVWEPLGDPNLPQSEGPYIGWGPFIIHRVDRSAGVVRFRRNPHWRGRPPSLEGFDIHLYHNPDVLSLALQKGELDTVFTYAGSYPYAHLPVLEASDRFDLLETKGGALIYLGINLEKPPGDRPAFRQALAAAVDYRELIRLEALGRADEPRRGFIPAGFPGAIPTGVLTTSPTRAARLLDKAGCVDRNGDGRRNAPDGSRLELILITRREYARLAELIRSQLDALGLPLMIKAVDLPTWQALKDRGAYHLSLSRTTPWGMRMHAGWASGYFDSRRTGAGATNTIRDPAFHELCDRLSTAVEPGTILKLAHRIQMDYAQRLPALALFQPRIFSPVSRAWFGWRVNPLYGFYNLDTFLNLRYVGGQ